MFAFRLVALAPAAWLLLSCSASLSEIVDAVAVSNALHALGFLSCVAHQPCSPQTPKRASVACVTSASHRAVSHTCPPARTQPGAEHNRVTGRADGRLSFRSFPFLTLLVYIYDICPASPCICMSHAVHAAVAARTHESHPTAGRAVSYATVSPRRRSTARLPVQSVSARTPRAAHAGKILRAR